MHETIETSSAAIGAGTSEAALLGSIMHLLPTLLTRCEHPAIVAREVKVSRSIADAVVVASKRPPRREMQPLSVAESVVLSSLRRHGPTRVDILERRCGVAARELRFGLLKHLEQRRLVSRQSGGRIVASARWLQNLQVIAIEAKLTKWRQALSQASAYRRYANQSFVVLPQPVAELARINRAVFAAEGVGLIAVDGAARISVVLESAQHKNHDWQREFVCSRLLT